MLSDKDNELICRVGTGTPMGEVFRRFWIPFLISSDLAEPDGDPIHVELLGENYVAFRDSSGTVGLLDEYCCHRGVSLTVGRVENCGIRCIYHGWLFAADGTVLETPNVPDGRFKSRIKAKAYPVREAGGFLWAYLGSARDAPPFPDFPWIDSAPEMRLNTCTIVGCNYVQVMEGLLDGSHLSILHSSVLQSANGNDLGYAVHTQHMLKDSAPRIEAEETDFGLQYVTIRMVDGKAETRVVAFISPFYNLHPHGDLTTAIVPINDTKTAFFNIWWDGRQQYGLDPLRSQQNAMIGTSDEEQELQGLTLGSFDSGRHPSRANHYRQDRHKMRSGHFSGAESLMMEDVMVSVSARPLRSRINEHLATSDAAVAQLYKMLLKNARSVASGGRAIAEGMSVANIAAKRATLAPETDWHEIAPRQREALVANG